MANNQLQLTEDDLAGVVLSDLKRVVREYATAATESTCEQTRQMFTNLLNSTLSMQGQLFTVMKNNNMYEAASVAPKKELDKQIQSYQQMAQKLRLGCSKVVFKQVWADKLRKQTLNPFINEL